MAAINMNQPGVIKTTMALAFENAFMKALKKGKTATVTGPIGRRILMAHRMKVGVKYVPGLKRKQKVDARIGTKSTAVSAGNGNMGVTA